jgi:hypothetical protein
MVLAVSENVDLKKQHRYIVCAEDQLSKTSQKYDEMPVDREIFKTNQDNIQFPNALAIGQEFAIL